MQFLQELDLSGQLLSAVLGSAAAIAQNQPFSTTFTVFLDGHSYTLTLNGQPNNAHVTVTTPPA